MKRIIDHFLREWKDNPNRKPLLLRGARQVGKTHAARELGKSFPNFVEINLETNSDARKVFEKDLNIERILQQLSVLLDTDIKPHTTLLFLDEIQHVPQTVIALRYFYEFMPELHVVAAGSLLDFAIEKVGAPVGRITQ
ncbi:MAG: AAA family ATPase, partial [Parachlamydiaceae bacterium]|nr:AAA family ATPase [Parachlamydiaceae bacterium]